MPKITDKKLVKVQIRLFEDDYKELQKLYGTDNGTNRAIRAVLHAFLVRNKSKVNVTIDELENKLEG